MSFSRGSRRRARGPWFWAVVALLVHAELILVGGVLIYVFAPRDAELRAELAARTAGSDTIEIGMMDDEAARKLLAEIEREAEKAKAEIAKREIESTKAPGQVVEIPKPREERRPEKARFASEYDSTVERETKRYGRFDERARQGDPKGRDDDNQAEIPALPPPRPASRPSMRAQSRPPETRPSASSSPLASALAPAGALPAAPDDGLTPPSGGGPAATEVAGGEPGTTTPLVPSERQIARAIGGGTQDALRDVDEGDETALNSKKWKFAAFFNRVKRQVADHWHPDEAYRRGDPTGQVYGQRDRLTVIRVQLKPDGSLANVALDQQSGVDFLDDEAVEAFKQAQPFPNPPRQLIEEGGVINFRFGFLFELSSAPRFRVFRYNSM